MPVLQDPMHQKCSTIHANRRTAAQHVNGNPKILAAALRTPVRSRTKRLLCLAVLFAIANLQKARQLSWRSTAKQSLVIVFMHSRISAARSAARSAASSAAEWSVDECGWISNGSDSLFANGPVPFEPIPAPDYRQTVHF